MNLSFDPNDYDEDELPPEPEEDDEADCDIEPPQEPIDHVDEDPEELYRYDDQPSPLPPSFLTTDN
jgi:hypothetical protein